MIRIDVDHDLRTRFVVVDGVVTDEELLRVYGAALARPDFDPGYDDVVDLTTVDRIDVTREGLRDLVHLVGPLDRLAIPSRLAIVAPRDDAFGLARMYGQMRGDVARQIRVFRTRYDALQWLAAR